jgi:hypothetical protein
MKKFIIVFILSCGFALPQSVSNTQQGRLVPKKIVKPPVLAVLQPFIQEEKPLMVNEKLLTVKGTCSDEVGISSIKINGVTAEYRNGEFYGLVDLKPGLNSITVNAVNIGNISCEKSFFVTLYVDNEGPQITIVEPSVTRGIKIVSKKDVIHIQGNASDESGVREVYVNGGKVSLDSNNHFSTDLALTLGDNALIIKAFDKKNNLTIDTFYVTRNNGEIISAGKYFAFIIGIDKYKGTWPALGNAVHDAKSMEDELKKDYGFNEVISLYNEDATRANIISKFEDLTTKISKDDNLLIFYSGHGDFKQQYNKGYWVPVDATSNSTVSFISNSDIQTYINGINSRHILLIADACFTGDIFRGQSSELPFEKSDRYIMEAYSKSSRFAMTSGNIQPVADGGKDNHSVFTYYLLKYLKEINTKYFSARELFNNIERPVINNSEQEPQYKPLKNAGDEGGQFIFIRK